MWMSIGGHLPLKQGGGCCKQFHKVGKHINLLSTKQFLAKFAKQYFLLTRFMKLGPGPLGL